MQVIVDLKHDSLLRQQLANFGQNSHKVAKFDSQCVCVRETHTEKFTKLVKLDKLYGESVSIQ